MKSKGDKIKGQVNSTVGKAKETAGRIFNDKELESKGMAQEDKGHLQQVSGKVKDQINKGTKAVGDAVEKAGKKIRSES